MGVFWIILGVVAAVIILGIRLGLPVARRRIVSFLATDFSLPERQLNPLAWIEVLPDDCIRLYVPKAEMGQGAHTGLAQIAAEELEVSLGRLEVVHASTRQAENKYRGTFGSQSIASLYGPLRRAAATMREMLRAEASARLALRTQQILACESGVSSSFDPLAGSYFVESLPDELEEAAGAYLAEIDALGGALRAIDTGFQQREIQESAYRVQREIEAGEQIVVGLNRFADGQGISPPLLRIDEAAERAQVDGLRVGEVPVQWSESEADESTVRLLRDSLRFMSEVIRLKADLEAS